MLAGVLVIVVLVAVLGLVQWHYHGQRQFWCNRDVPLDERVLSVVSHYGRASLNSVRAELPDAPDEIDCALARLEASGRLLCTVGQLQSARDGESIFYARSPYDLA